MKTELHRRVSIFDITPPYPISENRYSKWLDELAKHKHTITDVTACGEFVYSRGTARNLRIEVDSRFMNDTQVFEAVKIAFDNVKTLTKRNS